MIMRPLTVRLFGFQVNFVHEMGLSALKSEVLAVKIEVDTNPPQGAGLATTVVRRFVVLRLHHHDQPTLLAGSFTLFCKDPTPRDATFTIYFGTLAIGWPQPNYTFLNNALAQTVGLAGW